MDDFCAGSIRCVTRSTGLVAFDTPRLRGSNKQFDPELHHQLPTDVGGAGNEPANRLDRSNGDHMVATSKVKTYLERSLEDCSAAMPCRCNPPSGRLA